MNPADHQLCCRDRTGVWLHPAELHELAGTITFIRRWLNQACDDTLGDLRRHVRELEGHDAIGELVVFDQLDNVAGILRALLADSGPR